MSMVLALLIALPIFAHTEAEILEWEGQWETHMAEVEERFTDSVVWGSVRTDMLKGRATFKERHPCYFSDICSEPEHLDFTPTSPPANPDSSLGGMGSNWEQWRPLVASIFPPGQVDTAICIIRHESGGNPNARNASSGAAGLFQIMPFWWEQFGGDRYDPGTNTTVALAIWQMYGWGLPGGWNTAFKC